MRLRLDRSAPSAADYQVTRRNETWRDHVLRTQITGSLISWLHPNTVIDPAAGDGSIVQEAHAINPIDGALLGDISRPNFYLLGAEKRPNLPPNLRVVCQTIEETLSDPYHFDLCVLTEILEHVEDPVDILRRARERADFLVASSPLWVSDQFLDTNPEHLWMFDAEGYDEMLGEAGWSTIVFIPVHLKEFMYDFQIWAARNDG